MTEQVLRELRDAIVDGRIPEGEQLRETRLAETLGTGRSAIREAIRQKETCMSHDITEYTRTLRADTPRL
jgi:DNA-binding FadR family transcriptional regulator